MARLSVDFSGVTDSLTIAPGLYVAKVVSISKEAGKEYPTLKWDLLITSGSAKGLHINHYTTLKPEGLFNLRNTLIACGLTVPKSAVSLDTEKIIGKSLGIEVFLRKADNGNEYSNIKKTMPASEVIKPASEGVSDLGSGDITLTEDDL